MINTIELGTIAKIKGGKRLPKGELLLSAQTPHPYIRSTDINEGKIDIDDVLFVDPSIQKKISRYIVKTGDVILSIVGTIGLCAVVPKELDGANLTENCIKITEVSDNFDSEFIYYFLTSPFGQKEIQMRNVGSTQPKLPLYNIKELPIPQFDKCYQRRIARTLSLLDAKIDLLRRQNATLEALGAAVFREWFVEGEWEERSLLEQIQLVGGGTPKTSVEEYWGGNIPWLSGGDIASNHKGYVSMGAKAITELGLNNSSAKLLPANALVISARGTVGKYAMLAAPMTYSQSNYGILPLDDRSFYYTYLLVDYAVDRLSQAAYGSVFDTITTRTFKNLELPKPSIKEVQEFELKVQPLFHKVRLNTNSILELESLRDLLLPKLMSGQVRVRAD